MAQRQGPCQGHAAEARGEEADLDAAAALLQHTRLVGAGILDHDGSP